MKISSNLPAHSAVMPQNTAGTRTAAGQAQSVSPAYQVDISPAGEQAQFRERIQSLFGQLKTQGNANIAVATASDWETLKSGSLKGESYMPISDEYGDVLVYCEPNDPKEFFLGDGGLWSDIVAERALEATGLVEPLHEKSQQVMDKYFQAASAIEQGGASAFRKLNLEFAGVAYAANQKDLAYFVDKGIAQGSFTREEYNQAQSYAAKLQSTAGVFVQVSTGDATFSYSYNGTIASVGVKTLNLMAAHEEAEAVWTKAVQGQFQNNGEVLDTLKAGGFADAAQGYEGLLRSHVTKYWTMDYFMQSAFVQEKGKLWEAAVGKDKLADFQAQYGGSGHFTYTAQQLSQAYLNGQQEAELIHSAPGDRDPSDFYVTEDGRLIKRDAKSKEQAAAGKPGNSTEAQINALQEKIQRLRQQLSALHKNPHLSPEDMTRQTENYQKQIETFQRQIMDIKIQELERQKHRQ